MSDAADAAIAPVLRLLTEGAEKGEWRRCVVTPSKQASAYIPWERFVAQPVKVSRGVAVKIVTRSARAETTNTVTLEQWPERLREALDAGPCNLNVLTREHDWHARRTRDGRWLVSRSKPSQAMEPTVPVGPEPHDRVPQHALPADDERTQQLFIETGLFGKNGRLLGESAAKYRQVQHYLELLRPLPVWNEGRTVRIVDAGCGKAYLSLALSLWAERQGCTPVLTGIDSNPGVIASVRGIAERLGMERTEFRDESVAEFTAGHTGTLDLLVSLHACDTATDEALAAGVRLGARAIVLAPCCQHELSVQMERNAKGDLPAAENWQAVMKSGLFSHRLADLVTDALRAAALEALGYKVDVLEFIDADDTAKNVMIRASKRPGGPNAASRRARERYKALADYWGVKPSLERLLGNRWS